jgi:hypothetical protein
VNDTAAVRVVQGPRCLINQLHDIVDAQQIVGPAISRKGAGAVHMLGHDVTMPVLLARIVDGQNIRVLQHADHVRFGQEHLACDALAIFVAAGIDVINLDGDVAAVVGIVREIHDARAAAPDLVDDHVLADLLGQRSTAVRGFRVRI